MPSDDVLVTHPRPDSTIESPLMVKGKAKGTWYFEASFPVELIDADGNVLVTVPAEAQSDWMTTDFVDFEATLSFKTRATTGFLIFRKDNPSGLPQFDDEVRIPIRF